MAVGRHYNSEYVRGNTARKLNTDTGREEYRGRHLQVIRNEKKQKASHPIQSFDFISLLFMISCVGVTLYFCLSYIQVQHSIHTLGKGIATLESEINDLKNQNDAAYNRIDTSVDLSHVYDVAVKELGMVSAAQSQIRTFSNVKSDYVRCYGEIPEAAGSTLEQVFANKRN